MDEVPVEQARGWMDRVDIRDEAERRLRSARGEHLLDLEAAERSIVAPRLAYRAGRLRKDVVRERIAGMRE